MINNNFTKWVVGIIVVVNIIFLLYTSYGLLIQLTKINELTEKYTVYDTEEGYIKQFLTEDGYEVLFVSISNYSANAPFFEWYDIEDNTICDSKETICYSDKIDSSIEMKSLGSRNEQIWVALITMGSVYENAFTYKIKIKSPTDTCDYLIFGDTYRTYTENYDSESRKLIQSQIDNSESCS